jgi:hypothetical protein
VEYDDEEPNPAHWDRIGQRRDAARKQSRRRAVWMCLTLGVMLVLIILMVGVAS